MVIRHHPSVYSNGRQRSSDEQKLATLHYHVMAKKEKEQYSSFQDKLSLDL